MKKLLTVLTLGLSLTALTACSVGNDVVVKTNSGEITREELQNKLVELDGAAVLEKMIEEKVLKDSYSVTDKELNAELKKIKSQFPSDEEFKVALESNGIKNEKAFKTQLETSLLQKKAVTDGVSVTDKQLKEYYEANKDKFKTVTAQHILVQDEKKANELKQELEKGADFAKLAKENSIDQASAEKGGDLGEFKKGQMVAEFDDVAFTIKPGTLSNVVKSQYGYHIIKVNKRTEKKFEQASEEAKEMFLLENAKPYQEVIKKLMDKAKVDIKDKELKDAVSKLSSTPQLQTQQ